MDIIGVFFGGLIDGMRPQYSLHLLWKSSNVKHIIGMSLLFNSFIFLYNVYYSYCVAIWYPAVWNWIYPFYFVLWVIPSFSAALILNSRWNNKIAKLVCKEKYGESKNPDINYIESIYGTFLIYIFHLFLIFVDWGIAFWPLRLLILYAGYAWLTAFYLFETRLIYKGFKLPQRIEFLQRRWLYFLGYGTPLALMYMTFPYHIVYTLYNVLSNLMVVNTIHLVPQRCDSLVSIPIFGIVKSFTNWLMIVASDFLHRNHHYDQNQPQPRNHEKNE